MKNRNNRTMGGLDTEVQRLAKTKQNTELYTLTADKVIRQTGDSN